MPSRGYTKKFKIDPAESTKSRKARVQTSKQKTQTYPPSPSKLKGARYWEPSVDLFNEYLFRFIAKRRIKYIDRFLLDLNEHMHLKFSVFLKYLKSIKFINHKLIFDNARVLPMATFEIITTLHSKMRGLSLPVVLESDLKEFVFKAKQIRRCKSLTYLKFRTMPANSVLPFSIPSSRVVRVMKNNFRSHKKLKGFGFYD